MRKTNRIVIFSLILSLIFSIIGFAETNEINIIKIGLQYTAADIDTVKPLVAIKGNTGFELGELISDQYVSLVQLSHITQFSFDKDNGYHAVVGPYATYEEANAIIGQVTGGFVVKSDNYYVYSTSSNQSAAQAETARLTGSGYSVVLGTPNANLVVIKNGTILLGFDSSIGEYIMAPLGSQLKNSFSYFGNVSYRGGFGAKRVNTKDITLINYIMMDEYLYGVVPREMDKSWPIEALKAQAIVARNFAVVNFNKFSHYGFNLDNTTNSQVYGGYKWEGPLSNQAVDETSGLTLKHEKTMVNAFYHSNSGGFTENSENVFSSPLPYIKGVYDPFSIGAPNDTWSLEYSKSFIENRLKELGYNIGSLKNFYVSEYTDQNRVYKAIFIGTNDHAILSKQDIRKAFGYNEVKSTLLKVVPDNSLVVTDGEEFVDKSPTTLTVISGDGTVSTVSSDVYVSNGDNTSKIPNVATKYVINGKGWGHGLGMSQWGAKNMAEQGFEFEQILTFYYTDTHIE